MNNTLARVQNLVGQAGEALGLTEDPLSTVVGSRVSIVDTVRQYDHLISRYKRPPEMILTMRTGLSTWRSVTSSIIQRRVQKMQSKHLKEGKKKVFKIFHTIY